MYSQVDQLLKTRHHGGFYFSLMLLHFCFELIRNNLGIRILPGYFG